MKAVLQRIAALEARHRPIGFRGLLEGEDLADAISRAPGPGIFVRFTDPGDSCELIVLDRLAGKLEAVEILLPHDHRNDDGKAAPRLDPLPSRPA